MKTEHERTPRHLDARQSMRRLAGLLVMLALPLASACNKDDDDTSETSEGEQSIVYQDFDATIGLVDEQGAFQPLQESNTVEIVVGFQGLIFIDVSILTDSDVPETMISDASVSFPNEPSYDFTFRNNFVSFEDSGGQRLCRIFQVPFWRELALIKDQPIELNVPLTGEDWQTMISQRFTIVDDEDCYQVMSGEILCE